MFGEWLGGFFTRLFKSFSAGEMGLGLMKKVVKNPGKLGSTRWYYNEKGEVVYGEPPMGHRHPHNFADDVEAGKQHLRNVVMADNAPPAQGDYGKYRAYHAHLWQMHQHAEELHQHFDVNEQAALKKHITRKFDEWRERLTSMKNTDLRKFAQLTGSYHHGDIWYQSASNHALGHLLANPSKADSQILHDQTQAQKQKWLDKVKPKHQIAKELGKAKSYKSKVPHPDYKLPTPTKSLNAQATGNPALMGRDELEDWLRDGDVNLQYKEEWQGKGAHRNFVFTDKFGNRYLAKPAPAGEEFRAYADHCWYMLSKEVLPEGHAWPVVPVKLDIPALDGEQLCSVQMLHPDYESEIGGTKFEDNLFRLEPDQQERLMAEHVMDWLTSQHDTHADNIILLNSDPGILGIDKGQAFKFMGQDTLAQHYKPPGNVEDSAYGSLWADWEDGTLKGDPNGQMLNAIKRIENMDESQFLRLISPYAERLGYDKFHSFMKAAKSRKANIRKDFETFLTNISGKPFRFKDKEEERKQQLSAIVPTPEVRPAGEKPETHEGKKLGKRFDEQHVPVFKAAEKYGAQGAAISIDSHMIEDHNIEVWQETGAEGEKYAVCKMKLTEDGSRVLKEALGLTGTELVKDWVDGTAQYPLPMALSPHTLSDDSYGVKAAKAKAALAKMPPKSLPDHLRPSRAGNLTVVSEAHEKIRTEIKNVMNEMQDARDRGETAEQFLNSDNPHLEALREAIFHTEMDNTSRSPDVLLGLANPEYHKAGLEYERRGRAIFEALRDGKFHFPDNSAYAAGSDWEAPPDAKLFNNHPIDSQAPTVKGSSVPVPDEVRIPVRMALNAHDVLSKGKPLTAEGIEKLEKYTKQLGEYHEYEAAKAAYLSKTGYGHTYNHEVIAALEHHFTQAQAVLAAAKGKGELPSELAPYRAKSDYLPPPLITDTPNTIKVVQGQSIAPKAINEVIPQMYDLAHQHADEGHSDPARWEGLHERIEGAIADYHSALEKAKAKNTDHKFNPMVLEALKHYQEMAKQGMEGNPPPPTAPAYKAPSDFDPDIEHEKFLAKQPKPETTPIKYYGPVRHHEIIGSDYEAEQSGVSRRLSQKCSEWGSDPGLQVEFEHGGNNIIFRPFTDDARSGGFSNKTFAFQGEVEVRRRADGGIDGEPLDAMLDSLEAHGLPTHASTPLERELLYLHKIAYFNAYSDDKSYPLKSTEQRDDARRDPGAAVGKLREFLNSRMRSQIERHGVSNISQLPYYDPEGRYAGGARDGEGVGGIKMHYRPDLTPDDVEPYVLHHKFSGDIENVLGHILDNNGVLCPTTQKPRFGVGVSSSDTSPVEDCATGGGSYVFTRLFRKGSYNSRQTGITFKGDLLRRLDAISYETDEYGRCNDSSIVHSKRKRDPREWDDDVVDSSNNETLLKGPLPILPHVHQIITDTPSSRAKIIDLFHDRGITHLPDGRSIEEIVLDH